MIGKKRAGTLFPVEFRYSVFSTAAPSFATFSPVIIEM
jgi:hypothetical protein